MQNFNFTYFRCECQTGFEGMRCEVNVNDCEGNLCENNSTCIDKVSDYECRCKPGYEGRYCQTKIAFCNVNGNPCSNGGKCKDHFTHYTCDCPSGFSGLNCTTNVDDCANHMCQNGGSCVDGVNKYTCECPAEFTGKFCEIEPMVAQVNKLLIKYLKLNYSNSTSLQPDLERIVCVRIHNMKN